VPSPTTLVYGATGYTGRLIVDQALARGMRPILAGRNRKEITSMAAAFDLDFRIATLDQPMSLREMASSAKLLLNAAGPFSATSRPLLDACLAVGTHYVDVTGEVLAIEAAAGRHEQARARGVMVMPGVGFDVVPSDCLAAHLARRLPGAETLRLGLEGLSHVSRGSAKTIIEQLGQGVWIRREGKLRSVTPGSLSHTFDFGSGPRPSLAVSWGDVSSAFFSTGIPNIEVYFASTAPLQASLAASATWGWLMSSPPWQTLLKHGTRWLDDGPSEDQNTSTSTTIVAEATRGDGRNVRARLRTPGVYSFTAISAVAIAERALAGDLQIGFQTPSRVYGPDFVLSLDGVSREDA
jgi:short subunit dehydrogenase-like uncharacterized protein